MYELFCLEQTKNQNKLRGTMFIHFLVSVLYILKGTVSLSNSSVRGIRKDLTRGKQTPEEVIR